MKRYKYDQLRRAQEKKLYYKMYKAGKNWIIAGLTMVGFSFMFSMAAKADVDEQQPNTENLDTQAEKEQQNIAQVTSTDTNEQLLVTETPTTSNNEPKENEATPAKVETGENTVESAKQPEPQVATNEVVASRAEDTTPVIRRARTVASTTAVTEDDIDQKTVRTENMIDWLQDGLFSGDNKNALTTPILPNDQNGKRNNQAPFNINSAAMSQLSYNTLYYPFVKKLQAAYKAEDYKELTNMAAILQAIYGKVNTEQLITGIFTPEDNYKADQALANAKLNRSVAVIVSMDQDGHILSQSVGLPDSFVTGSGGGYKVEDGSLEDTGYISWPSAILDIVVGKNGTDMISYDPARAATIPNDPPKTLGVYKYIGSEYYHSTVNQDLIKYADNDPMKTKFAVADYSANKKKIIPEGHALTYIINRYQTQVAPVDKTAQTTITYKGNKGNVLTVPAGSQVNLSGKEGQEVEIPTPPTIKGYTFNFPRFNGQRTSVGSKVTLEKSNELIYFYIADPVPAKVTVAYKSGDTVLTPATPVQLTGNIDDEVSVPSPPTISGYTFNNVLLNGETSSIGATVTLAENNTLVYNYRKDAADAVTEVVYQNVNGESQTAVLGKIDTRSIPKKAGLKYTITDGPEAVIPGKGIQPAMKILFNGQEVTKGQVVTLLEKNTLTYIFPARTTTPTQKPAVTTVSYKAGTETLDPTTPVTLTGNVGTKVNVPTAPTVIGYTLEKVKFNGAEVPVGSQVTLLATNTLEYSYTKDPEVATTTVEYKSGETPVTPTTSVTLTGNVGNEVTVPTAPTVSGYHYVNATFNGKAVTPNSKVTLEKVNKLVYNYAKDLVAANTTVSYKAGTETLTPTTQVTLTGNVGEKVSVPTAPTVSGYTLEKVKFNGTEVSAGSKVTLLATNTLEYVYTKDPEVATTTVEYKSGETLVTPTTSVTLTGNVGNEVTVPTAPTVSGYHYVNATFNGKAVTPNSKVTLEKVNKLVYNYAKDLVAANTTVSYKAGTETLTPTAQVTLTGNVGEKVSVPTAPTVSGYTLEKVKFNGTEVSAGSKVTLLATNTLEYVYTKDPEVATTTVEYKSDETSVTPTTSVTLTGNVGNEVTVPTAPTVAGYHYVNATFNGKAVTPNSKVTLEKVNKLVYNYAKDLVAANTTVSYKAGTETLTPTTQVTLTGNVGEKVSVPTAPTVAGYHYVNATFNGKAVTPNSKVTLEKVNKLVYNYAKDPVASKTTVSYKAGSEALAPSKPATLAGNVGEKVNVPTAPTISGYTLERVKFNGAEVPVGSQVTLLATNTLEYAYTKDPEVATTTVEYKSGETSVTPTTQVTLTGNVGNEVTVPTAPTVAGYHYVNATFNGKAVTPNSKVTLEKANKLVYNYARDPEVATTTVEYKSGETPVTPTTSVTLTGNVGSEVTVPTAPTVAGYHYVNATFNGKAVTPNSKVTLEKANKLVYNYAKDPEVAETTVSYKAGTETLNPTTPVTLTGNVGTKVSIPTAPTVTGYTLEKVKFNGTDVSAGSLVTLLATNMLEYSYTKDPEAARTMVNYKAGTEALIPTALVTLTGNVGDEVTVPTAPVVSGYTFKNMTFNGTEVKTGSKVTLEKTNTLAYNYTKDAKQPTTSNVTIYYRDVNDSKDDKYTVNSGILLAQYTQALRGEVGNVYANTLSEVEQAGYMVAKSDTGVLSGSYLANDATYYVYLTHAKKEQTHQVTVTRTIQYQDETGSSVAKAVEQKQVFDVTEMVDQVNKQVVSTKYAPANATFEQVISPVKDGYIFEKAVPAKEITATSPSETVTVGYKAQPQRLTYTVVDKDEGDKVLVKEQLLATGTTDQVLSATAKDAYQAVVDDYRKAGYKVVELPELPSSFDTDPTNDQNLVFVLAHDTKKVPGKSKEVAVRVTYRYGNGPKQGESAAKTKEQFLTFTSLETRDAVTDKVLETKWSEPQQSDTFKSPNVVNYVADKKQVGALEVTAAMGPQNLEVNYYTAQAKGDLETPWGELPVASSVIQNTAELAQLGSKTYIWKKQPNVEPIGYQSHTSEGVVSVVYADGTEQEVPVTVKVAPQAKNYAPKAKAETVTVSVGQLPAPESLIADFEQLPGGTKASWGVVPDVTKEGTSTGLIEVLYPDNTRDLVEVALEVKADLAKKETIPAKPFLAEMRENGEQKVGLSKKQVNDQSGEKLPQTGEKEDKVSIFGALVMTLAGALGMNVTIKKKRK